MLPPVLHDFHHFDPEPIAATLLIVLAITVMAKAFLPPADSSRTSCTAKHTTKSEADIDTTAGMEASTSGLGASNGDHARNSAGQDNNAI